MGARLPVWTSAGRWTAMSLISPVQAESCCRLQEPASQDTNLAEWFHIRSEPTDGLADVPRGLTVSRAKGAVESRNAVETRLVGDRSDPPILQPRRGQLVKGAGQSSLANKRRDPADRR